MYPDRVLHWIDDRDVGAASGETFEKRCPMDDRRLCDVARGAAADDLAPLGISAAVIDLPWLNRIDEAWLRETLGRFPAVLTLDNHYVALGQGTMVAAAAARAGIRAEIRSLGLTDIPACGSNAEVLAHHGLDAAGIVREVRQFKSARQLSTRAPQSL